MDADLFKLIIQGAVTLILIIWGVVKAKYHLAEGKKGKIFESVEEGVKNSFDIFVKETKDKNEDGKLSKDEIQTALDIAWNKSKEVAKQKGIDLAKELSREYFPVLVDKVIKSLKKKVS